MTLLVVLGVWFAAGLVATLVLGPRLRRAAEEAGPVLEQEPVYVADRSPMRWRLGTLGVVGLLAGSTGMAAAGALPGSAQTIAHHVLGTVGVQVPESPDAPTEVATGPGATPSSDAVPSTSSPRTSTEPEAPDGADAPPALDAGDAGATDADADADLGVTAGDGEPSDASSGAAEGGTTDEPAPTDEVGGEPSDVEGDTGGEPGTDPTVVPEDPQDPSGEEPPPTTTTTVPPEEPPPTTTTTTPPGGTTTSTTTTTTTTLPPPPPPVDPAG